MIRLEISKVVNGNFPARLLDKTIYNLPDFLTECEEVFQACESEVEKTETQYNENYRIGCSVVETRHALINQLLSLTKRIVDLTGEDERQDKARVKAAGIMKKIGHTTDKLSSYLLSDSERAFTAVNKSLIDGLYLDLLNVNIDHADLTKTDVNLQKALLAFALNFQPISIPPAPKMHS